MKENSVLPGTVTNLGLLTSLAQPQVGQIVGRAVLEKDPEAIADLDEPLSGTRVLLTRVSASVKVTQDTITDAEGIYAFSELAPGDYEILATRDGFTPALTEWTICP